MNSRKVDIARHRLPSSSRLAELVLESSADFAVFTICLDGVITSWNSAAERVMGWSEEEAVGRDACMIFTPEDQAIDACASEMTTARHCGRAADERWHLRKDGTRFWGSGSMTRLEDDRNGEHIGYVKIVRDRTEQHLAGERLRTSEAVLRGVFANSADSLKLLTPDGRLTSMNGPGLRMLEIDGAEHVRGREWVELWPEEERGKVKAALAEALAGRVGRFHGFRPAATGTLRWWDVQVTAVPGPDGRPELLLASSRDVTERERSREALRLSEERLRTALSIRTVGVMFWGEGFGLTEVNDAFLQMTGFSREEAIGKTWQDLTPPEFYPPSLKAVEEVTTRGETTPYEKQYYRRDGSRWWGLFAARRLGDEVVEFVLDVTDRKEAEAALRTSEERFRALVAASTATVWTTDAQGVVREDSPSWRAFTGQALEQWLGVGWADAVHPDDRAHAVGEWAVAVAAGRVFDTEYRLRSAGGEWRLVTARGVPVRNSDGSIREWVGTNTDITAQRRAEEARRAIEEHYQLAVRATNDAIWDWDLRCDSVEWNEALQETYGHPPERVCPSGDWWLEQVHPDDRERVSRSIHAVIDGGGDRWSDEYRFRRADGGYADVLDRGFMVRGPGGEPLRMIGAMLDITARRQSERELRRLNEHLEVEVSRRTEQLRLQEEALRQSQKLEAVGQLTGGVAHDFNNLLTVIRSSAGLLRRSNLPEERRRRYVEAISETAERAAKLTGQLLAFARRQPLRPEVFVVGDRVRSVVELVRPLVGAPVTIETFIECEGRAIEADPNQFETALVNLAVNARDAMEGEGRLRLRTWLASGVPPTRGHAGTRGSFVAVSVSDTGVGIQPEMLGRIFEPFFTTKEAGKGTGLGLSQVYGFAKQSGGELHVESEVGQGSTFTLYLPQAEAKPVVAPTQPTEEVDAPAEGRRNVLLIEDNTQVGEFARQMLEDLGYVPTWASNAKAALELLESDASRFDMVFSDVVMPGMNGLELGKEIRRRWPSLPVVLTSGYSHVLANDGAQGFELLNKPYSAEGLSRVLRSSR
ncbi:PAS domain S-box protein [Roseomonas sp. KE2513]|uniref:PAS domain S-box protein n=1 Tax=Roseomonas sp. KE2513 TaxID=2479202 RepID=UPI0018DF3597|nr:PAS domain S-box protein [Roseomonas sp. KE2513]MBI0534362.1 PAS domain S-box protein [Roseomonas sp. KE2513]